MLNTLTAELKVYTKSINDLVDTTKENSKQIQELKLQPGAVALRWIWIIVGTLTTGFIGLLFTLFNLAPK